MNYSSFYEGSIVMEDSQNIYDFNSESPSRTLMMKIVNGMKQFIDWLVRIILKLMQSIRNLWNKLNTSFARMRGDKFVIDEFGYMDKINECKPLLDSYFDTIIHLNKVDHQINKGLIFEDKAMNYVGNGVKDTLKIGGSRNTRRDYQESFTNYMVQAERYKNRIGILVEEAYRDIPTKHPKSYSINVLKHAIETEFNSRLARMKDLQYQLQITQKTYHDNSKFLIRHFGKMGKDIKRNNELLKHCGTVIDFTEKVKMLQVRLSNQVEGIEINEKDASISLAVA